MSSIPATVLVIEAHPLMREALCFAITNEPDLKAGMQAGNVMQALQMVMTVIPDIILLAMDHRDQNEMDELMALHKSLPATPILALTSNEEAGQEQTALTNGAQVVLTKAAPRAELLRTLRKLRTKTIMNHSEMYLKQEADGKISHQ